MEKYEGVKFNILYVGGTMEISDDYFEIIGIVKKYIEVEGNEGNISLRDEKGMIIKETATPLFSGSPTIVTKVDGDEIYTYSGTPSSESRMHWEIYKNRKDANIIIHFHGEQNMKKEISKKVGPLPYGTIELAEAVGKASKNSDLIEIREHGYIIIAKDKEDLIKKLEDNCK